MPMKLKANHASIGNKVVTLKEDEPSVFDLLGACGVENVSSIRFGYPPSTLPITDANLETKLDDLGVQTGERIVLETGDSRGAVMSPPAAPTKPHLQIHKIPDDNSCLFHSVSYCIYRDLTWSASLRQIVSDVVVANPQEYTSAILDKPNREYSQWILRSDSWGGGIEISILAKRLATAIYVVDMDSLNVDKFLEAEFDKFILIMFNGIHYDAIEMSDGRTVFDKTGQDELIAESLAIASELKRTGHSFNTHVAKIKCNTCGDVFVGERAVSKHAESTGHTNFGQT
ncbi:ubiquitin-specific protease OTU1 KNAG_0L00190 [Huiozyma naganishii CBS 8797]|uniref:Ubiquitin thioesterase OTU n=1 Tax=Huiozyma naganishii (strain ATCC MYA-139 / BCRC 22969 / CBS 8797 / KCTC 17520 / NBRC 10181 / NCYC 3082 / Yp74L-3) TaxID=1071383 RepID=J7S3I4_HUIN7|nr:hypothetical protein KNAG_0L00190 [Kazachstania naganishii CBS 8797]CCK72642.1 hypothetical protein KNAG_0L00190 [Kazachstania naganishii CBS 8797]